MLLQDDNKRYRKRNTCV